MKRFVLLVVFYYWFATITEVSGGELKEPIRVGKDDGDLLNEDDEDIPRVRVTPDEYKKIDGEGPKMSKIDLIRELRHKYGPNYEKNEQYKALRRNINMLFGNNENNDMIEVPIFYIEEQENKDAALIHAARLLNGVETNEYHIYKEALDDRERRYNDKLRERLFSNTPTGRRYRMNEL